MGLRFFKCKKCGNIIVKLVDNCDGLMCCGGDNVVELKAGVTDAAKEKHVPVAEVKGNVVAVKVGSVPHPMTEEHLINFIVLETNKGFSVKTLDATSNPSATFALEKEEKALNVYAYCNLHGLWMTSI